MTLEPTWTRRIQLWCSGKQLEYRNATKIPIEDSLRFVYNVPWYMNNEDIYGSLSMIPISQQITEYSKHPAKQLTEQCW